ncbi:rhodanese-like domain-containing protein [Mycolicibacterium sp.]|uniref:rhodanese-like domain-containing protein n=1 Tax=Mycolicibacterium sp. TaxID=2320850 RepID=UPI00090349DC|nr:sulfurtransferase [Mycobacterium sp. WY10]
MTTSRMMVTAAALRGQLGSVNPPRVVDVRTPGEFRAVHIGGAYNVPLDLLREHRDEIRGHLDEHVVLVCRSGQRAVQAEQALRSAGLVNLHILDGGMNAWEAAGFDVNRGTPRWELERQVRFLAGIIVALSVLAGAFVSGAQWVAFVMGIGLAGAAATNTCVMGMMLARLPYNRGPKCDADEIVRQLVPSPPR